MKKRGFLSSSYILLCVVLLGLIFIGSQALAQSSKTVYKALNPRGYMSPVKLVPLNLRLPNLDGKKIYFVGAQSQALTKLISQTFQKHVPTAKVIYLEIASPHIEQPEIWKEVKEKADACIVGVGSCGGMSPKVAKWTADVEKAGIPAAYIVYEEFAKTSKLSGASKGIPYLRCVYAKRGVDDKTNANAVIDPLVKVLTKPLMEEEKKTGIYTPPKPPRIAVTGTMDEIQEYFQEYYTDAHYLGWTDQLPIIPPTEKKVTEMLKGTSHAPNEVVCTMWPEKWEFTVEKVAINGVMAGCNPEYMPVLLAMAEAFGTEKAFLPEVTSSTSFSFMTLVSGAIGKEIGMNAGMGIMGPCNRANATIGRALRLFIINLGGGWPGVNLMSSPGNSMMYSWCFAEDNENSPWKPFHTTMGFKPEDNCVTVFGGGWTFLESWGVKGLEGICQQLKAIPEPFGAGIIISHEMAKSFEKEGLSTRKPVQKYLWENTTQTFKEWSNTIWYKLMKGASKYNIYGRKFWPMDAFKQPPDAVVKRYARPEHMYIIVAGHGLEEGTVVVKLQFPHTVSVDKWR